MNEFEGMDKPQLLALAEKLKHRGVPFLIPKSSFDYSSYVKDSSRMSVLASAATASPFQIEIAETAQIWIVQFDKNNVLSPKYTSTFHVQIRRGLEVLGHLVVSEQKTGSDVEIASVNRGSEISQKFNNAIGFFDSLALNKTKVRLLKSASSYDEYFWLTSEGKEDQFIRITEPAEQLSVIDKHKLLEQFDQGRSFGIKFD